MKKYIFTLIFILVVGLWPFFKSGFFQTHDGEWMIIRFSAFHQTFVSGQIPVRFVDRLANGFGYTVLNFLYPLPFYISEVFKLLGFGFADSIKITFVFSTIGSSLAMFWALKQLFSREASFAGSIIYLFTPYRFVDLYVRGSIGENLAFVFIPLILGSIYKIKNDKKIFLPLLSLSTAGLILSHNVIAFIFLPILFIITLLIIGKKFEIFANYLLGIFIAAFFWIPALYDLRYVQFSQSAISDASEHLVSISKLIIPSWGYGPNPNGSAGLSVQVGLISLFVITAVLLKRVWQKSKNFIIDFMILLFFASSFMMTNYSKFVWTSTYIEKLIQFPWRLLSVIVFSTAFLTAYLIDLNKKKLLISAVIIIGSLATTLIYTKPASFVNHPDGYYSTNEDSTTVKDEYLPIWVKVKPQQRANRKLEVLKGDANIGNLNIKSSNYIFTTQIQQESKFRINTFYYPGWQVISNGQNIKIDKSNVNGLMDFTLPKGKNKVVIKYGETPVHLVSELMSLVALFSSCIIFVKYLLRQ